MQILPKTLILALTVAGGALFASAGHAQQQEIIKYCKPDIERLCSNLKPGGGRLLKCLKSHPKEISVGCGQALQKLKG